MCAAGAESTAQTRAWCIACELSYLLQLLPPSPAVAAPRCAAQPWPPLLKTSPHAAAVLSARL